MTTEDVLSELFVDLSNMITSRASSIVEICDNGNSPESELLEIRNSAIEIGICIELQRDIANRMFQEAKTFRDK